MSKNEALNGANVLPPEKLINQIFKSIFSETIANNATTDSYRKSLQRALVEFAIGQINSDEATLKQPALIPPLRQNLLLLYQSMKNVVKRANGSNMHRMDIAARIKKGLEL